MSLFLATFITGTLLSLLGLAFLLDNSTVKFLFKSFPRSRTATYLCFGLASLWFLTRVWNLSMADFGEFRKILFIAFAVIAALAFVYVPDFLAVRGLAALVLLSADPLLSAGFGRYEGMLLFFKAVVYVGVLLSLWLGAQPYRLRDAIEWLHRSTARARLVGGSLLAVGLLILSGSFTY